MNIYDFFNSTHVANHCRKLEKTFDSLESAVLVYRSKKRSLKEKHAAYRTIISEYPDVYMSPCEYHSQIRSVHEALKLIIEDDEKRIKKLLKEEPEAFYIADTLYKTKNKQRHSTKPFKTYEEALSNELNCNNKFIEYDEYGFEQAAAKITFITIEKNSLAYDNTYLGTLSPQGDILDVQEIEIFYSKSLDDYLSESSEYKKAHNLIMRAPVNIPVPFKRGDIVEVDPSLDTYQLGDSAYVMKDINGEDSECYYIAHAQRERNHNITEGTLRCHESYYDLQYCRRELVGEERILKYISLYEKGEINIYDLLAIHRYLLLDKGRQKYKDVYDKAYEILRLEKLPF